MLACVEMFGVTLGNNKCCKILLAVNDNWNHKRDSESVQLKYTDVLIMRRLIHIEPDPWGAASLHSLGTCFLLHTFCQPLKMRNEEKCDTKCDNALH